MTLELLHAPGSTCSQKVRMALFEKGLDWKSRLINLRVYEHLTPAYLALNPNGVVPTLLHDGDAIVDSTVINEYLEDVFPAHPLRPDEPKALARMRAWRAYIDEVPTTAIRVPSFQLFIRKTLPQGEAFDAHAARLPLRKHFYSKMRDGGFSQQDQDDANERLRQSIDRMENALADGRPWLCGDMFSLADISIMPSVVRLEDLGMAAMWNDRPRVSDWYERLCARPAFAQTYAAPARQIFGMGKPAC